MKRTRRTRRGVVLIQVVLMIVVLFGFVALTTDYGMMVVRQRRLQNVTDSGALAAGPELGKAASIPEGIALQYTGYYNADATATALPFQITVTAQEPVATPFASVLNSAWGSKTVHATSVVRAAMDLSAVGKMLRPVAFLAGPVGPSGAERYSEMNGMNAILPLVLAGNGTGYCENNFSVSGTTVTVGFAPLDIGAYGISGLDADITTARSHYIISLKGQPDSLDYYQPGNSNSYWLAEMMFVPYSKQAPANWPVDLQNWRDDTYRAVVSDVAGGPDGGASILEQVKARKASLEYLPDDPSQPGWPADNDPRLCVFLECNRNTGTITNPNKDYNTLLQGYIGFFITGMTEDKSAITGYIVDPIVRTKVPPGDQTVPPVTNYGIYTFGLTD